MLRINSHIPNINKVKTTKSFFWVFASRWSWNSFSCSTITTIATFTTSTAFAAIVICSTMRTGSWSSCTTRTTRTTRATPCRISKSGCITWATATTRASSTAWVNITGFRTIASVIAIRAIAHIITWSIGWSNRNRGTAHSTSAAAATTTAAAARTAGWVTIPSPTGSISTTPTAWWTTIATIAGINIRWGIPCCGISFFTTWSIKLSITNRTTASTAAATSTAAAAAAAAAAITSCYWSKIINRTSAASTTAA